MEETLNLRGIIVIVHALSAGIGVGAVLATDYLFVKFLRDYRITKKEVETMKGMSEVIWIALTLLVLSGIYLASTKAGVPENTKFILKMIVVGIIIINGVVLNLFITPRLHKIAFHEDHLHRNDVPDKVRKIATACGAISIFSWLLAFVLGSIRKIPFSVSEGILYYLLIIILITLVAMLTKKKADS